MKMQVVVGTIILALSFLSNMAAQAGEAQQPNPLFLKAGDLAEQLSASSLNDNVKTAFRTRFEGLKQTQEQLWILAGQVDGGQCAGSCIDLYSSRVLSWQSDLQSFIADAHRWLKSQPVDPNMLSQCLRDREKEDEARRRDCVKRPIEEHTACLQESYERKLDGTNTKCYGITTPIR